MSQFFLISKQPIDRQIPAPWHSKTGQWKHNLDATQFIRFCRQQSVKGPRQSNPQMQQFVTTVSNQRTKLKK